MKRGLEKASQYLVGTHLTLMTSWISGGKEETSLWHYSLLRCAGNAGGLNSNNKSPEVVGDVQVRGVGRPRKHSCSSYMLVLLLENKFCITKKLDS
jgi:hypothetical protein